MLDDVAIKLVENHLPNCNDCRETLKTMEILSGQIDPYSPFEDSGHLKDDIIAKYYENKELIPISQLQQLEEHLEQCSDCAYDLEFLNSLEQELNLSVSKKLKEFNILEKLLNTIPNFVKSPVLAYFLLILTVYPSYKWYSSIQDGTEIEIHPLISQNVNLLNQQKRGLGEISTLVRRNGELISLIDIQVDHSKEHFEYSLTIGETNSNKSLKVQSIIDLSRTGIVGISLHTAVMDDGDYILTLLEIDLETFSDTASYIIPFKLITKTKENSSYFFRERK